MNIEIQTFGATDDGRSVSLYVLTNNQGMVAKISTYGGIIVSLVTPDREGQLGDVVLGFENLQDYIDKSPYFGCLVGRYANRIAGGKFSLEKVEYTLARNDGPNSLHGGWQGFDKKNWTATSFKNAHEVGLNLTYLSPDGEEGYPGNLAVTVTYILTDDNQLKIHYAAATDRTTVVNLTNHSYFNLSGAGDILGHELAIYASKFTPMDETLIPTGELQTVESTPFDFTRSTAIGSRINSEDEQLKRGGGYDHNYVLDEKDGELVKAAEVYDPAFCREMSIYTTLPGIQFYSGNFLDGSVIGKQNIVYHRRSGFCLETQHYPDSPNQPGFPSTVLERDQHYTQQTVFKFSAR